VAGLSGSHFTRLFAAWAGESPAAYVKRARIQRARRLLTEVDLSIKQVAARCGFRNPHHFSRVFRRIDGLTPSAYREAALAAQPARQVDTG
jgi:transcriptional regulator GlxA family with amidase domain